MDEEVHGFASDAIPPLNTRVRSDLPFIPNGSNASAFKGSAFGEQRHHSKHHRGHNPDIGKEKIEDEVHGFASDNVSPINEIAHA